MSVPFNNIVDGTSDDDHLDGTSDRDQINGLAGNDTLLGYEGDDELNGGAGNDYLDGGLGNDTLRGDLGDDELHGGEGADLLSEYSGNGGPFGNDIYDGGAGVDRVSYFTGDGLNGVTVDLNSEGPQDTGQGTDTLISIEHVTATYGNDTLTGNEANNWFWTFGGFDQLNGNGGDDYFTVGDQDKVIDGGTGSDTVEIDDTDAYTPAYTGAGVNVSLQLQGQSQAVGTGNWTLTNIENLSGNWGNDTFTGDANDNFLAGAGGNDTLTGGDGDDVLMGDGGIVFGNDPANPGTYQFEADLSALGVVAGNDTLTGGAGNDLLYGGGGNDVLRGNSGDDRIYGDSGEDFLVGGGGNDVLDGGAGNDRIGLFDGTGTFGVTVDLRLENVAQDFGPFGFDTLVSIEQVIATYGNDTLIGNEVDNFFWTAGGNDTLTGNGGDDYFSVGDQDKVIDGGTGSDTVEIDDTDAYSPAYTAAGVNISLQLQGQSQAVGTGNWTLTNIENLSGNWGNDTFTGDANDNILAGAGGNDTLTGGDGNDVLMGDGAMGIGFDPANPNSYYFQSEFDPSIVVAGNDTLTGGNGDDTLYGGGGDDTLRGGTGDDVLHGDDGNDLLAESSGDAGPFGSDIYDGGEGFDRVSYFTSDGLNGVTVDLNNEGAQDTGQGSDTLISIEHITATYGNDTLVGNDADNWFWTFGGMDTLTGNGGNDYFTVGVDDKVVDGGSGVDTLEIADFGYAQTYHSVGGITVSLERQGSAQSVGTGYWTLTGIENLGGFDGNDALTGDANDNVLNGQLGNDSLSGHGGNDSLYGDGTWVLENGVQTLVEDDTVDGPGGNDTLEGGAGDDLLYGGGGVDTAAYYHASGSVTVNLATGVASGADGNDTLTGVENLFGSNFDDSVTGDAGANRLDGRAGADTMNGGVGDDTYIVDNLGDHVIESASTGGTDLVQSSVDFSLSGTWVENLTLTGTAATDATGNSLANIIIGNSAANILNGGAGADTMKGGAGDDTYYVDNIGDVVAETSTGGIDKVNSSVTFRLGNYIENLTLTGTNPINATGNSLDNIIYGNAAANIIDGDLGADTMRGGAGDDRYVVDNAGDLVIEGASAGTDLVTSSVTFRLGSNIENLTLSGTAAINGTGNALDNLITGNAAANIIDGGAGADTLKGGAGDDTYLVDDSADVVAETSTGGIDTVRSMVSYTLAAYVENLTLSGTAAIDGTGNTAANVIIGNSAENILNGGAGADTLKGGAGNDTYIVDNVGDVVSETSTGGVDTVQSSVSYTLANYVENLILTGARAIDATGNTGVNVLIGNGSANVMTGLAGSDTLDGGAGNDRISGGTGSDTLTGGSGYDTFVFDAALSASTNVDTITDFSAADDTLFLSNAIFKALPAGTLSSASFFAGTAAHDADDRVIYDGTTGNIYYDADGSGSGAQVLFAHVNAGSTLTNADFLIGI